MQRLVDLLEDRGLIHAEPTTPVYTVASLAEALGVSAKVVRGAIARGELDAVKRGGRWIIPAEAVDAWAHPPAVAAVWPRAAVTDQVEPSARLRDRALAGGEFWTPAAMTSCERASQGREVGGPVPRGRPEPLEDLRQAPGCGSLRRRGDPATPARRAGRARCRTRVAR